MLYREPFLGGGSLFLALEPSKAKLNDLNPLLIDMYRAVRDDPESVHRQLVTLANSHSSTFFYKTRGLFNRSEASVLKAAQFIYLNRSCFNGVFRVNRKSEFNVPWGKKERVLIPTAGNLKRLASLLSPAKLSDGDYTDVLAAAGPDDFVYLDPPYPPISRTSFFRHYTSLRFSLEDHQKVAEWANRISKRGAAVMISNADTEAVRNMFPGWYLTSLNRPRYVTANKSNVRRAAELIITNYQVRGNGRGRS